MWGEVLGGHSSIFTTGNKVCQILILYTESVLFSLLQFFGFVFSFSSHCHKGNLAQAGHIEFWESGNKVYPISVQTRYRRVGHYQFKIFQRRKVLLKIFLDKQLHFCCSQCNQSVCRTFSHLSSAFNSSSFWNQQWGEKVKVCRKVKVAKRQARRLWTLSLSPGSLFTNTEKFDAFGSYISHIFAFPLIEVGIFAL